MTKLDDLRQTVDKLATIDERRAALIAHRDEQVLALRHGPNPPTWVELQGVTHLTPRGLGLAIKRAEAAQGGKPSKG